MRAEKTDMTENSETRRFSLSRVGTLGLLTLSYMVGEVAHFLPAITSKDLAESLEFGDQRCYSSAGRSDQGQNQCSKLDSETGEYLYIYLYI